MRINFENWKQKKLIVLLFSLNCHMTKQNTEWKLAMIEATCDVWNTDFKKNSDDTIKKF